MFCFLSDWWTSLSDVCESFDEKQGMSKMLWNFLLFCKVKSRKFHNILDIPCFSSKQGMSKMIWNFLLFCKVQSLHKLVRLGSFNIIEPLYYTMTHISFVTQTFKSFHRFLSMVLLFSLIGQKSFSWVLWVVLLNPWQFLWKEYIRVNFY